jgi:hypothetical protein
MMQLRFRFSLRSFVAFVTVVAAYFGLWETTKRFGVNENYSQLSNLDPWIVDEQSPMPLIVSRCERAALTEDEFMDANFKPSRPRRYYYIWLFGPRLRLPFDSSCE